jgi:hypothetical protein
MGFAGNPYLFLGRRPFREARLRSYILRELRRDRPLDQIVTDAYVRRCGGVRLFWRVVQDPETIASFEADIRHSFDALKE